MQAVTTDPVVQAATPYPTGTPASEQSDFLNSLGQGILDFDYRWVLLSALALLALSFIVGRIVRRTWPSLKDIIEAILALVMIYTGSLTGSAFLLMRPPAVAKLTEPELAAIGLISLVVFLYLGVQEFLSALFIKAESRHSSGASAKQLNREPKDKGGGQAGVQDNP